MTERALLDKLQEFAGATQQFTIEFLTATRPEHMPVEVIPTTGVAERSFHRDLIAFLGSSIVSKYPEREDANYFPHMTIEWNSERVVQPGDFENTQHTVERCWLVKDPEDGEDSIAYAAFELSESP